MHLSHGWHAPQSHRSPRSRAPAGAQRAHRRRLSRGGAALCTLLVLACVGCSLGSSGLTGSTLVGTGRPILFIGNSLTYTNDLPAIVQALADSAGEKLAVAMVAYPDFSLGDHWAVGDAPATIAARQWEFVVLQQGPSALESSRTELRAVVQQYDPLIRQAGARPALYSVWPMATRQFDFPRAIESYTLAAADVDGVLFPVAQAWLEAWSIDPGLALYSSDGLHPSVFGSYVAGLVICAVILDRSPEGLPSSLRLHSGTRITIPSQVAAVLQLAARRAIEHAANARGQGNGASEARAGVRGGADALPR